MTVSVDVLYTKVIVLKNLDILQSLNPRTRGFQDLNKGMS